MKPIALSLIIFLLCVTTSSLRAAPRPNVVIIMADDMGYSDLGCFGSEIQTPNLDKLAAGGLRFTQFYNTARCCSTRASLLTGLYSHQAAVGHMVEDNNLPGYRGDLAQNVSTFAEALRPAGYGTYMVGKWHVTPAPKSAADDQHNWPRKRGFDHLYGTISGAGDYYDPSSLVEDDSILSADADPNYKPQTYYYTDALSDHAVRFIQEHDKAKKDTPLLLYVAYTSPHWPLHALEEDIAKYKGKYDAGYEVIRDARLKRMREMGIVDANWQPAPLPKDWADVKEKAWEARCMETYAAQIDRMDQGVGNIVEALRSTGRLDNTLILFLQDNGGCAEAMGRSAPANEPKASAPRGEGVPPPDKRGSNLRDGRPVRQGPGVMPGPEDTYMSYGQGWASVSNTPFREYKHWVHEGGISTPLVAHWPAGIKRAGELEKQPAHLIDVMATCLDIAGAAAPPERNGQPTVPLVGKSLVPAFDGKPINRNDAIYFEHEGNRAIHDGDWKLVAKGPAAPWELYDLKADRTELHDLAAEQPDRVKELAAKWETWAKRSNVLPWPWKPAYGAENDESVPKGKGKGKAKAADVTGPIKLTGNEQLSGEDSPAVGGRALRITAMIIKPGRNGVIVAQGGTAEGYTLYLKDGKPCFATRSGGKLTVVEGPAALPDGVTEITATLDATGSVLISAGGKPVANGKVPGTIGRKPTDGLSTGNDAGAPVGDYESPFAFDGKVGEVTVELTVAK